MDTVYYSVYKGHSKGVFTKWEDCRNTIEGYRDPVYNVFKTQLEANAFAEKGPDAREKYFMKPHIAPNQSEEVEQKEVEQKETKRTGKRLFYDMSILRYIDVESEKKLTLDDWGFDCNVAAENGYVPLRTGGFECGNEKWGDPKEQVYLFTDGSCRKYKIKGARAGYGVYFPQDMFENSIGKEHCGLVPGTQTNQRAEMYAIFHGLDLLMRDDFVRTHTPLIWICTDSEYCIKSCTKYITQWKKNGWKTAKGTDVLHRDLIQLIDTMLGKSRVQFRHVKAHTNFQDKFSIGNDKADKLAARSYDI